MASPKLKPSERFDWDKAIRLFKAHPFYYTEPVTSVDVMVDELCTTYQHAVSPDTPPSRCRKDLHDMTPENTYLNTRTGHRRCRACTKIAEQTRRKQEDERRLQSFEDALAAGQEEFARLSPHSPVVEKHDLPAEQLTPDTLPSVSPEPDVSAELLSIQIPFEKWPNPVQPTSKEPTALPEDDLARYRESDSPDTRLLADIATSLRILAGRSIDSLSAEMANR